MQMHANSLHKHVGASVGTKYALFIYLFIFICTQKVEIVIGENLNIEKNNKVMEMYNLSNFV